MKGIRNESVDSKSVRVSVIGAGLIGEKHAQLIAAQDGCTLAGICDVDPDRSSIARELAVPFYRDLEELLQSEDPEGAVVATPTTATPKSQRCVPDEGCTF